MTIDRHSRAPALPPVCAERLDAIDAVVAAIGADGARRGALAARLAAHSGIEAASVDRLLVDWTAGWRRDAFAARVATLAAAGHLPTRPIAIVAPGNLPVATFSAAIEGLGVGASVRVRPGSGDPDAAAAFGDLLADVAPALAAAYSVQACARGDDAGWRALLDGAGALVVFGGDASVAAVARYARGLGFGGAIRGHGAKLSVGLIEGGDVAALDPAATGAIDALLEAALLADGRGCLSLRALLVRGTRAKGEALLSALARRADAVAARLPAGRLALDVSARRRLAVEDDRLAAALGEGAFAEGVGWSLGLVDAVGASAPAPTLLGPGARHLRVIVVAPEVGWVDLLAPLGGHLAALCAPNEAALAQLVAALAGERGDELAADASPGDRWLEGRLGAVRLCLPAALQSPPLHRHDGVPAGEGLSAPSLA